MSVRLALRSRSSVTGRADHRRSFWRALPATFVTAFVVGVTSLVTASPAWAPPPRGAAGALPDGPGVYAAYRDTIQIVGAPDRSVSRPATYWCAFWSALAGGDAGSYPAYLADMANIVPRRGEPQSGFVVRQCFERGATEPYDRDVIPWVPPGGRPAVPLLPPDVVTLQHVEAYARAALTLSTPELATSPPAARLLTGFETWFALDHPAPLTVTAQVGEFWATAVATATTATLALGDGTTLTCPLTETAPAAAARPDCLRHTYLDSRLAPDGRFVVTATLHYTVTIATYLDATPIEIDPADSPPALVPVVVRQAQAVAR
jgi:hypothetical protein